MYFAVSSIGNTLRLCHKCRCKAVTTRFFGEKFDNMYSEMQKKKILNVINNVNNNEVSRYDITKSRLQKFNKWRESNGLIKELSDLELIDGFTEKTAVKLFDSIIKENVKETDSMSEKIRGQVLQPNLSDDVRQTCKTVLAVYVTNSLVSWSHINKSTYELLEWQYRGINHREGKKMQVPEILEIAIEMSASLPPADLYVMKAEASTLRAAGSDPSSPRVLAVNLQRARLVAMMVALIHARGRAGGDGGGGGDGDGLINEETDSSEKFPHKVYFLRPTLPYRLYGTLVGKERVSTEQTVETLLRNATQMRSDNSHVFVPQSLQSMFLSQKDLEKDMLGHCLLLALTFMDVCIYKNTDKVQSLLKRDV